MAEINGTGNETNLKQIYVNWKALTAKEVIQKGNEGQEAPTEVMKWAEEVSKITNAPDDVTYDIAQGETDIDKLNELLNPELAVPEETNNELEKEEDQTEEFVAQSDAALANEQPQNEAPTVAQNQFTRPPQNTNPNEQEELTLADSTITTDANEIIKRKERKGLS